MSFEDLESTSEDCDKLDQEWLHVEPAVFGEDNYRCAHEGCDMESPDRDLFMPSDDKCYCKYHYFNM